MSPYEVKLLIEINVGTWPLTAKRTPLLGNTIDSFVKRGLITVSELADPWAVEQTHPCWVTTKIGREVCNRFCAVDESGIKFCAECGHVLQ